MNKCEKCGKEYESTWYGFGEIKRPSDRLMVERGRDKVNGVFCLCPACTESVLRWIKGTEAQTK